MRSRVCRNFAGIVERLEPERYPTPCWCTVARGHFAIPAEALEDRSLDARGSLARLEHFFHTGLVDLPSDPLRMS